MAAALRKEQQQQPGLRYDALKRKMLKDLTEKAGISRKALNYWFPPRESGYRGPSRKTIEKHTLERIREIQQRHDAGLPYKVDLRGLGLDV
jgi:hypothetical protein